MSSATKMVSIAKVYGLKWKLKKNWDFDPSEMWKNMVSRNSSICARRELRNTLRYRPISPLGWVIGWIGIIPTIPCRMRIIIQYGLFLKNYLIRARSIVVSMLFLGVVGREHPILKWRS